MNTVRTVGNMNVNQDGELSLIELSARMFTTLLVIIFKLLKISHIKILLSKICFVSINYTSKNN